MCEGERGREEEKSFGPSAATGHRGNVAGLLSRSGLGCDTFFSSDRREKKEERYGNVL